MAPKKSTTTPEVTLSSSWYGHELKPLPLKNTGVKDIRESCYIEDSLAEFIGNYANRMGGSRSHALRRLAILGAIAEGYEIIDESEEG